jgi:chemotaxis protein MotB
MSLDGDFRKPHDEDDDEHGSHAEHEVRWLLPYADMITLLFALFIVLYAISSVNNAKLEAVSQSINKAFNGKKNKPGESEAGKTKSPIKQDPGSSLLSSGVTLAQLQKAVEAAKERRSEDARLRNLKKKIDKYAREHGLKDKIDTVIDERGLAVRLLSDKVLFDAGDAHIKRGVRPLLHDVAQILAKEPNHIRIEGHTDNVPIHTSQFVSNWELSAVRATTVLRLLAVADLSEERLSAVGYAAKRGLASNTTAAGRQKNRRVEIVVLRSTSLLGGANDTVGG